MTSVLMHSTRIAVHVLVDDDTGSAAALIMAIAALVGLLVKLGGLITEATQWVSDFTEAAHLTNAVFIIAFRSLAFGLGVRV